ncbi:MAG: succinate dehydrogenase cytochrome b subunit [Deltaproteobacteria bacterium]|nr:succinate dehydrogenase cytochrome b subunit [Deltaproteobacteria bacterium]
MSWLKRTLSSSSGRKWLVALSGLGLILFLVIHLLGNLQIFLPDESFNEYAHHLHDGLLIVIGDVGLLVLFPLHIGLVIWLARENRKARGATGYKAPMTATKQKRSFARVLASKTTLYIGLVLLVFVAIHVWQFRLHHSEIGNLRGAILETLANPMWAIFYVLGSLATGWHVFHGFQAAFRSLGFTHNRFTPALVNLGTALALLFAIGFSSIALWIVIAQPHI